MANCCWSIKPSAYGLLLALLALVALMLAFPFPSFLYGITHSSIREGILAEATVSIKTAAETINVSVELADTQQEWGRGLMERTSLPPDKGMLFVFPAPGDVRFWMKNMTLSLDMLFIDDKLRIVGIKEDVPPCKSEPCEMYSVNEKVQYVLELNPGFASKRNIRQGDVIEIIKQE